MNRYFCIAIFILSTMFATAQTTPDQDLPTFRVDVVERTAKAINYKHRGGATKIDFKGTGLMPKANGEAKVESKQGYIEIEVEFDDLVKPDIFGAEYMTFVLWAVTPEGRAVNLGEVLLNRDRSKLNVTTSLQSFGMVVTAEPYFAVTQPSDLVILENEVRPDTNGTAETISAKYQLIKRGGYVKDLTVEPIVVSYNLPLELYEAKNAVRIARFAKADKYVASSFEKAERQLVVAEEMAAAKKLDKKSLVMHARRAAQYAEDAREISLERQHEERLANERAAAAEKISQANAQAERERLEAARSNAQRAIAESARQDALRAQEEARRRAEEAERERLRVEREREELRARVLSQLNAILDTRDTDRGLIVNMSDVLFDTGKYTLRPAAREKLARISGIVASYPGLSLAAEGHTDNTGSEEFNQKLSERRAGEVMNYLVSNGLAGHNITAAGLGEQDPVADNKTAKGRQANRRVELIVSGEVIGTKIGHAAGGQ